MSTIHWKHYKELNHGLLKTASHSRTITEVWQAGNCCWGSLETVAEEVWKLLLTHCPCLKLGGKAASDCREVSDWLPRPGFFSVTDLPGQVLVLESRDLGLPI